MQAAQTGQRSTIPRPTFKDAPLSSINGFVGLGAHALLSLLLLFGQVLWAFAWPVAILLNVGGGILWFLMWNSYVIVNPNEACLLYTSPSPRDATLSRMPSSA